MITRHLLTEEFPEFAQKIHHLKTEDNHFKKLFRRIRRFTSRNLQNSKPTPNLRLVCTR